MNIFEILGPVMVGPSSSHTAGAVRIGQVTRVLLGGRPKKAKIGLHGSFADTGKGHGTDRALVAGLLGMKPSDMNIPKSFQLAKEAGLEFVIENVNIPQAHPNTAYLDVEADNGKHLEVQASSVGGGRIVINRLDKVSVNFTGELPTLIVYNQDTPGLMASVALALSQKNVNIATLQLFRDKRGGFAVMIIETDQDIPDAVVRWVESLEGILKVNYINGEEI